MPPTMTTGTRRAFAAVASGNDPTIDNNVPSARTRCGPSKTLEQRGSNATMLESGIRIVGMPDDDKDVANSRPEYDGADSATMTVNFRLRDAFLRNASTVLECPIVRINSLHEWERVTRQLNAIGFRAPQPGRTPNEYDRLIVLRHSGRSSRLHP